MALGRISSYAMHQNTLRDTSKLMVSLADQQAQVSSGSKSQNFAGLGGSQSERLLSMEGQIDRNKTYLDNNSLVTTRLSTTDQVLAQVLELGTDLKKVMISNNGAANNPAFNQTVEGMWQSLAGLMNTTLQGRYLFGGTRTDTPPADANTFPTLNSDGTLNQSYYKGSNEDVYARVDDNIQIRYNIRANSQGMQDLTTAFAKLRVAQTNDDFKEAQNMVDTALRGITSDQAIVNQNKVAVDKVNERHEAFNTYYKGVTEEIGNADLLALSTQVSINQGILQATFQTFAKINSLKLSDFLR
jgi:flagellar hook-associated protein 3 FlgL